MFIQLAILLKQDKNNNIPFVGLSSLLVFLIVFTVILLVLNEYVIL